MENLTTLSTELIVLASSWCLYFVVHSGLASLSLKRYVENHWPVVAVRYRLLYNLLATILIIPPIMLLITAETPVLWQWQGIWRWLSHALLVVSLLGFWFTTRHYDMPSFVGLKPSTATGFSLSPIHRFVRHPWYFFGLVLLWSRDMDEARLIVLSLGTVYILIGSRLEDKKLIEEFGECYRSYLQRVPGILPFPGRTLTKAETEQLLSGKPLT